MAYLEGQYVSGREGKPWLYDIYDFEKIQDEIRKRGMAQEISKIVGEGFADDWDLKKIDKELNEAGFRSELQEIHTLFRNNKKKCDKDS